MQVLVHQNKDFELLLWGFPGYNRQFKTRTDRETQTITVKRTV